VNGEWLQFVDHGSDERGRAQASGRDPIHTGRRRRMDRFIAAVAALSRVCGVIAGLLILVSVFVVCHMVTMRYFLGRPTIWQTEFVIYAIIASTLIGAPHVLLTRGHVNMDILPLYAGPSARFALALVAGLLSLAFCLTLTWLGTVHWLEVWSEGWHSDTVWRVPLWIPYAALPVGMGVLSLQYVADIAALATGRAAPFGLPPEVRSAAAALAVAGHSASAGAEGRAASGRMAP
jgi:TRAP-type C4-dicarboxylate transport system permease small subunit